MSNKRVIYEFCGFRLDPAARSLVCGGAPVLLPPKAFDTLVFLAQNPGRLLTKDELMQALWPGSAVEENNLSQCISILRKALGDGRNGNSFIQTIPRRGYQFVAPVKQIATEIAVPEVDAHRETEPGERHAQDRELVRRQQFRWQAEAQFGVEPERSAKRRLLFASPFAAALVVAVAASAFAYQQHFLDKLFEYIPLVLLTALLYTLLVRQCWRCVPWFFSYATFAVCADLARFISHNHPRPNFWIYWTTEAAYAFLGIGVMYEVYRRVFATVERPWWLRLLFPGMNDRCECDSDCANRNSPASSIRGSRTSVHSPRGSLRTLFNGHYVRSARDPSTSAWSSVAAIRLWSDGGIWCLLYDCVADHDPLFCPGTGLLLHLGMGLDCVV